MSGSVPQKAASLVSPSVREKPAPGWAVVPAAVRADATSQAGSGLPASGTGLRTVKPGGAGLGAGARDAAAIVESGPGGVPSANAAPARSQKTGPQSPRRRMKFL